MATKKTSKKALSKRGRKLPWRKNPKVWTDTFFEKRLLDNPSLMTSSELANAIAEFKRWSHGVEKYEWNVDPFKEGKEDEAPFSSAVWSRIMTEIMTRLSILGDLNCGRFKSDVQLNPNSRNK